MRWFSRLFVLILIAVPVGIVFLALAATESVPLVGSDAQLNTTSVERAKNLLLEHDPRKLQSGETKTVRMNVEELDLVLGHIIDRVGGGGASLRIDDGTLRLAATVELSRIAPDRYLNIDAEIFEEDGEARVGNLKVGRVAVPRLFVGAVTGLAAEHLYRASGVHDAAEVIQAIEIGPQHVDVTYKWKAGIVNAVRSRLVSRADREKLESYHDVLVAEITGQGDSLTCVSLIEGVFQAVERKSRDSDPVAENRAAIVVLAAYLNGNGLTELVPEAAQWQTAPRRRLKLRGRRDFAQHFSTSAALAATGGDAVSHAVGLYKEIDDADGGSGFSFKDLTADMAGTQFGKAAVADAVSARRLQQRITAGIDDAALIPDVGGLEENLSDREFRQRYGGIGGAPYRAVVADIASRIAALVLYRG